MTTVREEIEKKLDLYFKTKDAAKTYNDLLAQLRQDITGLMGAAGITRFSEKVYIRAAVPGKVAFDNEMLLRILEDPETPSVVKQTLRMAKRGVIGTRSETLVITE